MIRGIIFDCFGVLYDGSLGTLISLCPPDRLDDLRDANKSADYGYLEQDEYEELVGEILGRPAAEIHELRRREHIRNQDLMEFTASLRLKYKVGMLSNVARGGFKGLFTDEELREKFDAIVMSWETGLTKPHPEIFKIAAERLGLKPEECVMIDDLIANCDGARVVGMEAIQHVSNQLTIEKLNRLLDENA